jgi:hypothetical protein
MTKNRFLRVLPAAAVAMLMMAAVVLAAWSSKPASASLGVVPVPATATAPVSIATPAAPTQAAPVPVTAVVAPAAAAGPDAQSVIQSKCTGCHSASKLLSYRAGSASQAQAIVASMTKKGGLTQAEAQAIVALYSK